MYELILNNLPWFWLAALVIFLVIEAATNALVTIWFAIGSFVMIFISFSKLPFPWQLLIWAVISIILLICTRPFAVKKLKSGQTKTNVDSLTGASAIVIKPISKLEKGEIKVNGMVWTAESDDDSDIPLGSECIITSIQGVTAKVIAIRNV